MVYKVFLIPIIFLDHFLNRNKYSSTVLDLCDQSQIKGFASSASFFTIAYYLEKGKVNARELLKAYSDFIDLIPTSKENLYFAYSSSFRDLEDAFQYFTALNEPELDLFITQNINDYKFALSKLQVVTPEFFLNMIK